MRLQRYNSHATQKNIMLVNASPKPPIQIGHPPIIFEFIFARFCMKNTKIGEMAQASDIDDKITSKDSRKKVFLMGIIINQVSEVSRILVFLSARIGPSIEKAITVRNSPTVVK